ncbi:hypothetical protein HYPSUDRAFT_208336 [Hypholoma sublateritium FD-334 SS-4]|uniref:Uncharacterized protein n=1 Tax=Hypholoma sublateritium (strain FD-334 SS-4) TaxID=945553 RepID=A0A0D2LVJ1_HYPSF|nr:hypothetical protein HYPSUDRAFT_208336 [Hypholoma sublateritium FD-334 SS-4]
MKITISIITQAIHQRLYPALLKGAMKALDKNHKSLSPYSENLVISSPSHPHPSNHIQPHLTTPELTVINMITIHIINSAIKLKMEKKLYQGSVIALERIAKQLPAHTGHLAIL